MKDVFISYTSADQAWADWLAWVLEDNGYTVDAESLETGPHSSFVQVMQQGMQQYRRVLLILSPALLKADAATPSGLSTVNMGSMRHYLIPIKVENCEPIGYLGLVAGINLAEKTEVEAEQTLLEAIQAILRSQEPPEKIAEIQKVKTNSVSPQSLQGKELSECDPSKILFIKNIRDPNGKWAYTPERLPQMDEPIKERVFDLYWPSTGRGAKSLYKGDLMLLNQQAKITHVVEVLDSKVRENSAGYFRWVRIVWMPDEDDWSQLPHQREVLGFEPPTIGGGTAYSLANLSELQKKWKSLEAFQQHVFQVLTGTLKPQDSWNEDYKYRDQLKLRRCTTTVQGYRERLTDDLSIEMMQIPAGRFVMGSPEDEPERQSNEGPQHEVRVPEFFMGKYPVTQAEWRWVAETLPQVNRELKPDPSEFKGYRRPVDLVSWDEAVEFCDRLGLYTGRTYRLPSEAEWEYACRGGTTTPFHFGETITTELVNYDGKDDLNGSWSGSYGRGPKGDYRGETVPVDHFGVTNTFGLCDMHGSVWEWCLDHYHDDYEGAPTDGTAWTDEGVTNESRVRRGGSWGVCPGMCRSSYRHVPRGSSYYLGFRVVCDPDLSRKERTKAEQQQIEVEGLNKQVEALKTFQSELEEAKVVAEWLDQQREDGMAEKLGKSALAQYPLIRRQASKKSVEAFYFTLGQFLENLSHCLIWGRNNSLVEPVTPIALDDKAYIFAFESLKTNIPSQLPPNGVRQLNDYIDNLLEFLPTHEHLQAD
ncbi:SUMF1/EgtB/PvdO family nonheme iron enzyme [Nodosilinea sp. LEGE 07298]|uniref:SUMF1/EgtB/PvdO family nonheme iron enzyme n=1 Tax=Nodosilinea sp. LEGE 07298 TaxID=2777970 RepID=UPI0018817B17|nr:SUMF1/EgtB/PvdO family nonheme iron enzyme [Nodosilinea sp. LEGE 07298]MBE9112494.1 SUMF1/EgtB/PvdO family nonheme iron enzyme [Nodosilinea sp. LEGE 07298]